MIRNEIVQIQKISPLRLKNLGYIEGLRFALNAIEPALENGYVIGRWYWVVIAKQGSKAYLDRCKLVNRPFPPAKNGRWEFSKSDRRIEELFKEDIIYSFSGSINGEGKIFNDYESAQIALQKYKNYIPHELGEE